MQNKILIVMGSDQCLFDDLAQIKKSVTLNADYMAINSAGVMYLDYIHHWATYHPHCFPGYECVRRNYKANLDYFSHSHKGHINIETGKEMITHIWPLPKVNPGYTDFVSGSSTLFGVEVGLNLGYEKIIVCGAPLCGSRSDGGDEWETFHEAWKRALPILKSKVKSMSGWTKQVLDENK